jgi:uncharacterized RDD family membrane protein YckC
VTVVQTCTQCGAVNKTEAATCCFCDARLPQNAREKSAPASPLARPKSPKTEGNLAIATDWRSEVSSRLEAYRARHKRPGSDPSQPEFSFGDDEHDSPEPEIATRLAASPAVSLPLTTPPRPATPPTRPPQNKSPWLDQMNRPDQAAQPDRPERAEQGHRAEQSGRADKVEQANRAPQPQIDRPNRPLESDRMDIDVTQPPLNFSADAHAYASPGHATHRHAESPLSESAAVPVATLAQRRRAALLDTALLLFSYGAFLSLFAALGGRFALSKPDVAVVAATIALFYALYVALFTFFGGSTPGMMLIHLQVVAFDGASPTPGQLLWRSFGYLVSAGMLMFGFLAALWDEDHLTWHDRISQTYLTSSDEISAPAPPAHPTREDYRHRG